MSSDDYSIDVGGARPIVVNRYVVQHGEDRSLSLYWYQSRDRVVASEYTAKFWVMADAIRLNRTDTALVRVMIPIVNGDPDPIELLRAGDVSAVRALIESAQLTHAA